MVVFRRIRLLSACIMLAAAPFMFNCLTISSVTQPASGTAGDTLAVVVDAYDNSGWDNMDGYLGYFGVLLPDGWAVLNDSVGCSGPAADVFVYSSTLAAQQEGISPAPAGYYWWVGQNSVTTNYTGSGTVYIVTGKQVGTFSLDYMTGDQSDGLNYSRSNGHQVVMSAPELLPPDNDLILAVAVPDSTNDILLSWNPGSVDSVDAYQVGIWYRNDAYPGGAGDTDAVLVGYYTMDDSTDMLTGLPQGTYQFCAAVCDSYFNWADTTAASCGSATVQQIIPLITGDTVPDGVEDETLTVSLGMFSVTDYNNTFPDDHILILADGEHYTAVMADDSTGLVIPAPDYEGALNIEVYVADAEDTSAVYVAAVTLAGANDAPVPGAGNALTFNGSNEYCELPYTAALNPAVFTISFWARVDGGQGTFRAPVTSRTGALTGYGFYAAADNTWQFWTGNGTWNSISGPAVVVGEWVHLAAVYDGTTQYLYVNGDLAGSTVTAFVPNTSRPFRIGAGTTEESAKYFFNGSIDEVHVWNVAQTADEIRAGMYRSAAGNEAGLAGCWNFNQSYGSILADATANGNDAVLYNTDDGNWAGSDAWDAPVVAEDDTLFLSICQDPDGDSVTLAALAAPVHGTLTLGTDGLSVTYVPAADWNGTDTFTVSMTDAGGLADTALVAVSVPAVNDLPYFTAGASDTSFEDAGTCTAASWATGISAGPADEAAQVLSFVLTTDNDPLFSVLPALDAVTGDLTYTPALYASGEAEVYVSLQDDGGTSYGGADVSAVDTFRIVITPLNDDAPVAGNPGAGNALDLTGTNDYVRVSGFTGLSSSAVTVEYWFRGTSLQSAVRYQSATSYIVTGWSNMHILINDGGTAGISVDGNNGADATDGNWHHLAFTWQQNTVDGFISYFDGRPVDMRTSADAPIPNIAADLFLGSYNGASEFMSGHLDEVRIWSTVRTADEIHDAMYMPLAGDEAGLVAYYRFDEDAGTDLPDQSVNGWDGVLYNTDDTDWGANTAWDIPAVCEDGSITLSAGYDPDGDSIFAAELTAPLNGTLSFGTVTPSITYTPDADFFGTDSFTYVLTDTTGLSDTAVYTVTVTGINDAPSFTAGGDDTVFSAAGACTVAAWATGINAGAANESLQVLTFVVSTNNAPLFTIAPAIDGSTGDLVFTPVNDNGGEAEVYVRLADNGGNLYGGADTSGTDTFRIVVVDNTNDPPLAGSGNALEFDGVDDYVLTPLDIQPAAMAELTMEAWIRPDRINHPDWQGILCTDDGSWDRGLWITSGSNSYSVGCGAQWIPPVTVVTGGWHHVAVVYSATDVLFYYDGVAYSRGGAATGGTTVYDLKIGIGNALAQYFQGAVDEVRIWNGIRSAAEIRDNMYTLLSGAESGLAAYYRFDRSAGTGLPDITGNLNNGVLTNMDDADWIASPVWNIPSCLEDDTLRMTAGYDTDSDSLILTELMAPANGVLAMNSGTAGIVYAPSADFSGIDSFTYALADTFGLADTLTVIVSVASVNDAPVFTAGGNDTVFEDAGACTTAAWATGMYAGAVNESLQTLGFNVTTNGAAMFAVAPAIDAVTGDLTFTPAVNANGSVQVYAYLQDNGGTASGGIDASGIDTFSIVITPVNDDPPVAGHAFAGNALNFDAVNDYVSAAPSVPTGGNAYTIEAWVKPAAMGTYGIIGWGSYGVAGQCNALRLTSTGIINYWWGNDLNVTTGDISGAWHHVAATFDGTTRSVYLDGELVGSDTPTGLNVATAANFGVGITNSSELFNGSIDEARVWSVARSASEIRRGMNVALQGTETGLAAYYPCDELNGMVLPDHGPGGYDGTLTNMADDDWILSGIWDGGLAVAEDDTLYFGAGYHPDGDSAVPAVMAGPFNGNVILDTTLLLATYMPAADFYGSDSLQLVLTDTFGRADTAWVSVAVAPVNDGPVVTAPAGGVSFAEEGSDSSLDLSAVFTDIDDTLSYSYYVPGQTASETLISDGFESGALDPQFWSTSANPNGRIAVNTTIPRSGSYSVLMDAVSSGTYALNEMVLSLDLRYRGNVVLSFYQAEFGDEDDAMPASFTGSGNYDGVAFSADGTTWYRLVSLTGAASTGSFQLNTFDLDAAVAAAGVTYTADFKIKFQQYDNYPYATDGFAFDDISVNGIRTESENLDIAITAAGAVTIIGKKDFFGTENLVFVAEDTSGLTAADTVTVTVTPVGDPPVAGTYPQTVSEDDTLVCSAGYHPDGDSAIPALVAGPFHGSASVDTAALEVMYVPAADYYGPDSLRVAVADTFGRVDTAWIAVTVEPVNDAPFVSTPAGDVSFIEDGADTSVDLSAVFTDIDDTMSFWYFAPSQTAVETVFVDGFESGSLDPAYWTTASAVGGQVAASTYAPHSGSYSIIMDSPGWVLALNEMVLTLDISRSRDVALSFYYNQNGAFETPYAMPASFTGSTNADGVAFSVDGTTWYRLVSLTPTAGYTYKSFDLDSVMAVVGIHNPVSVMIKFQQYDNYDYNPGQYSGILFDDITVTGIASASDNLNISISGAGPVIITAAADYYGSEDIVFATTDTSGASAYDTVTVTVTPGPDPVTITSAVLDTAQEMVAYGYVVSLDDTDGDAVIALVNNPGWLSLSGDTVKGTPLYGDRGDTSFTVIASNAGYADTLVVALAVTDSNGMVPVELTSFTASAAGSDVILRWTTATEAGNLGFNVLKSVSVEGPYEQVNGSLIPGAGTIAMPQAYTVTDVDVTAGIWYYVLEQVDMGGSVNLSDAVTVDMAVGGIGGTGSGLGTELLSPVVYDMNGMAVPAGAVLQPGVYIRVHNGSAVKFIVVD